MKNHEKKNYPKRPIFFFFTIFAFFFAWSDMAFSVEFKEVTSFGSNPGNLKMFVYIPEEVVENTPLVVSLHGCRQDAAIYSRNGWREMADYYGFYVLFPQQPGGFLTGNNPLSCFNWFEPGDTKRNSGEAQSIKSMVDTMLTTYSIDQERVFIEGLSAGGYMTAVMLAAYPEVFKGGAINAGGPSYCASNSGDAFQCMNPGVNRSPEDWARLVKNQGYSGFTGPWPKVSIWHGTTDPTVAPLNQEELVEQWTSVHGVDMTPDKSENVSGYPHREYHDSGGNVLVESWSITGMGHATPVDPDFSQTHGCGGESDYIKDKNICAVYHIAQFWGLGKRDTAPPKVVIVSPSEGQRISGSVEVSLNVSDNEGVAKVQYLVEGNLRAETTASPFTFTWDSAQEQNGSRVLAVRAYDAAGNMGEASVSVIVEGGIPDNTPCTAAADPGGGTFTKTVTVYLTASEDGSIFYTIDGSTPGSDSLQYSGPLVFTESTTLSFFCRDIAGNSSPPQIVSYHIPKYEEMVNATSTAHYNAGRLSLNNYLKSGRLYGYIDNFTLYRFVSCWTDDIHGSGKLGSCTGGSDVACTEWSETNESHEDNGRARSSWAYIFPFGFGLQYSALGSGESLGRGSVVTTLRKEDPAMEVYNVGQCR